MIRILSLLSLLALIACNDTSTTKVGLVTAADSAKICSGQVIGGVTGTASCSGGGVTESFYIFSTRADNGTLDFTALVNSLWSGANPVATRAVATFQDAISGNSVYSNNYSVIPKPTFESDGRYEQYDATDTLTGLVPEKMHYLETIAANYTGDTRNDIQICGLTGNIEARIANCRTVNGVWSFYSGAQYGQIGEGDWSLVTVVVDGGASKFEVWRDERTKLLWSDKAKGNASADPTSSSHPDNGGRYNWYQASGYSKNSADSIIETEWSSEPGDVSQDFVDNWGWTVLQATMQPASAISVCPDIVGGGIAAGGGEHNTYAANPETAFKGNLNATNDVIWKLPSLYDFRLADVNGIRKVLPNIDNYFWTSTSYSYYRGNAYNWVGGEGNSVSNPRHAAYRVRCVGFVRD